MLVLSRKAGESIRIDDNITVTILELQGQRIKLGIQAPRDYRVLRGEMRRAEPVPMQVVEMELSTAMACLS